MKFKHLSSIIFVLSLLAQAQAEDIAAMQVLLKVKAKNVLEGNGSDYVKITKPTTDEIWILLGLINSTEPAHNIASVFSSRAGGMTTQGNIARYLLRRIIDGRYPLDTYVKIIVTEEECNQLRDPLLKEKK